MLKLFSRTWRFIRANVKGVAQRRLTLFHRATLLVADFYSKRTQIPAMAGDSHRFACLALMRNGRLRFAGATEETCGRADVAEPV
jgi:hypothetical protein